MFLGIITILLLIVSNVFMTFAWYGHLRMSAPGGPTSNWPLYGIILLSWGVALLEYCFQVPANKLGFEGNGGPFSLIQLKVIQEVITLTVFVGFSFWAFDGFEIRWNHILAFVLLVCAVYLVFMK